MTAFWWVTEAVPLPVASLVPMALLPLFGILTSAQLAGAYGHPLVLLLLGGFLLSKAMEKSGAHRRIALKMVRVCGGTGGKRLVLGFMLASAFLSMWISNTATTLMLLPVAIAVMGNAEDQRLRIHCFSGSLTRRMSEESELRSGRRPIWCFFRLTKRPPESRSGFSGG